VTLPAGIQTGSAADTGGVLAPSRFLSLSAVRTPPHLPVYLYCVILSFSHPKGAPAGEKSLDKLTIAKYRINKII